MRYAPHVVAHPPAGHACLHAQDRDDHHLERETAVSDAASALLWTSLAGKGNGVAQVSRGDSDDRFPFCYPD